MPEPLCADLCAESRRSSLNPKVWVSLERIKPEKCPGCAVLAEIVRVYSPTFEDGNIIISGVVKLRSRSDTGTELPYGVLAMTFQIYRKTGVSGSCVVITAVRGT